MANNVIGIDPVLVEHAELRPRRERTPLMGIAPGPPQDFSFVEGQTPQGWSISTEYGRGENFTGNATPYNGYLHFHGSRPDYWGVHAALTSGASLENASVTVAFPMRANGGSANPWIMLPGGLVIDINTKMYGYLSSATPRSFISLGVESAIAQDNDWHKIVMAIQSDHIKLWEDDVEKLTWTPTPPLGDTLNVAFGLFAPSGEYSYDLGDMAMMVGTTQHVLQKRGVDLEGQTAIQARQSEFESLYAHVADVKVAASALQEALKNLHVGPFALFWGITPSPELKNAATAFTADSSVKAFQQAAKQQFPGLSSSGFTFTISIGMTAAFVISGGYQIGLMIGSEGVYAFLTLAAGAVTNVEVDATLDLAFYPLKASQVMGGGAYVDVGGGEVIEGHIGVTGNIPLHFNAWDNCGPMFDIGVGVGFSPFEVAGGFTYTFQMAKLE